MGALVEGQRFERYRVLRWLGQGVSGESYEAEDLALQKKVLLKLIHPWSMLPDAARRQFFREVQGISVLTHPYLAATLDYGEVNGQLYIARRYVGPGSLLGSEGRTWYRPPLEIADAFLYTHQIARALHHIHTHGYTHGALTLANLLVLRVPLAEKGADFAPFLLSDIGTNHFVRRFGQPPAMPLPMTVAPEQLNKRLTPASDQYALAVLLYFWLAGHPPFLGSPAEIEQLKLAEIIPPLASPDTGITRKQEEILRRALRVYPDERYPSVLVFAEELLASLKPTTPSLTITIPPTPFRQAVTEPSIPSVTSPSTTPAPPTSVEHTIGSRSARQDIPMPEPGDKEIPVGKTVPLPPLPAFDDWEQATSQPDESDTAFAALFTPTAKQPAITIDVSEPAPQPEPLPQIVPDVPQPLPGRVSTPDPLPTPDPVPAPEPLPEPEPAPEIVLPPAPDIAQPGPAHTPIPPSEPTTSMQPQDDAEETNTLTTSPDTVATVTQVEEVAIPPHLVITSPFSDTPQEIQLDRRETTIGHAGSSDILLDKSALTSRHHALLKRDGDHYFIFDSHSTHGVSVNNQQIPCAIEFALSDGDNIGIGEYTLHFRFRAPHQSKAAEELSTQVEATYT